MYIDIRFPQLNKNQKGAGRGPYILSTKELLGFMNSFFIDVSGTQKLCVGGPPTCCKWDLAYSLISLVKSSQCVH